MVEHSSKLLMMDRIEILWERLHRTLYTFVRRRVSDKSAADDIVQEIFLKMHANLDQLRETNKVEGWIFQIARNAIADYFRRLSRFSGEAPPETPESAPDEDNPTRQLAQWLPVAIASLPDKYREALYLTEIEGLSQKELAERLNISYSGAKSRVQRGREMLREVVLQCCEVATDAYGNVLGYQSRPRKKNCNDC